MPLFPETPSRVKKPPRKVPEPSDLIEKIWNTQETARSPEGKPFKYPKEVIAKALALSELGMTARSIAKEFGPDGPSDSTISRWVREARLIGLKLPDEVLLEAQQQLIREARRKVEYLKSRFGKWAPMISEKLMEAGQMASGKLRDELAKPKDQRMNFELIRVLTQTIHHLVRDISLLAGMPTDRQASVMETAKGSGEAELEIPPEELADRLMALSQAVRESGGNA